MDNDFGAFDGVDAVDNTMNENVSESVSTVKTNDEPGVTSENQTNEIPLIPQVESKDGFGDFDTFNNAPANTSAESKNEFDNDNNDEGKTDSMDNDFGAFDGVGAVDNTIKESTKSNEPEVKSEVNQTNEIPLLAQAESEDGFGNFDSFNSATAITSAESTNKLDIDDYDGGKAGTKEDNFEPGLTSEMNERNQIPLISQVESEDGFGDFDTFNNASANTMIGSNKESNNDSEKMVEVESEVDGFGAFDGVSGFDNTMQENNSESVSEVKCNNEHFNAPEFNKINDNPNISQVEDDNNTKENDDDDFGAFDDANDVGIESGASSGNNQQDGVQDTTHLESEDGFGDFDSTNKTSGNIIVETKKESDKEDDDLNKVENDDKDDFSDDDDFGDFGAFEESKVNESYEQDGKDPFLLQAECAFEEAFKSFGDLNPSKLDSSSKGFNPLPFDSILVSLF